MNLEEIEKWLKKIKECGITDNLTSIPNFYFHPREFWTEYKELSREKRAIQFLCYAILFAFIVWLCQNNEIEKTELVRIVFFEVIAIIPYFMIVLLATYLSVQNSEGINAGICLVQCCYTKFLLVPFQIIFWKIYIETESCLFVSLSIIITLVAELFVLIVPIINISDSAKKRLIYLIAAFVLINAYDSIFLFSRIDFPRNYFSDLITEERYNQGQSLNNAYSFPYAVCTNNRNDDYDYFYSAPNEDKAILPDYSKNSYIQEVKNDIDSLKLIQNRCRFEGNKEFFRELLQIKNGILYAHEYKTFMDNPIFKETVVLNQESVDVEHLQYRVFSDEIVASVNDLFEKDTRMSEQFVSSIKVLKIGYLWHPVQWITNSIRNNGPKQGDCNYE